MPEKVTFYTQGIPLRFETTEHSWSPDNSLVIEFKFAKTLLRILAGHVRVMPFRGSTQPLALGTLAIIL
jgi:hypothetical protein